MKPMIMGTRCNYLQILVRRDFMPLFKRNGQELELMKRSQFSNERELQNLVELNLERIFNCRLISTEFQTGNLHAGRIDSLAISEDNNPVIIEYKVVESSQLLNQSLYYLSWLKDHNGDFQVAAEKRLGTNIQVDWSSIRVICLAPGYKKYDLHAVKMMGCKEIELWAYKYYENGTLELEEIHRDNTLNRRENNLPSHVIQNDLKKEEPEESNEKLLQKHISRLNHSKLNVFHSLQERIIGLDEQIEEVPKKHYIAYKLMQNFVCVEIHKNELLVFLKIDPDDITKLPSNARSVKNIGHYGTGDLEIRIKTEADIEETMKFIEWSYRNING